MLVENVEQAVAETPEEEERGYECDGEDELPPCLKLAWEPKTAQYSIVCTFQIATLYRGHVNGHASCHCGCAFDQACLERFLQCRKFCICPRVEELELQG